MNFEEFVKTKLTTYYDQLRKVYLEWTSGATDDCLSYYRNHIKRFNAMLSIIRKNKLSTPRIVELGSFLPYTAYQLDATKVDCFDILFDLFKIEDFTYEKFGFKRINLCTELPTEQYDLAIISEVIEHLPCSLVALQERIINWMPSGGHLLVTYPMIGTNAKDYDMDYGEYERTRHEHLREFTNETVPQFFTKLTKVDESEVTYPAYGRIKILLYRKDT